jgi:hypothetical protein
LKGLGAIFRYKGDFLILPLRPMLQPQSPDYTLAEPLPGTSRLEISVHREIEVPLRPPVPQSPMKNQYFGAINDRAAPASDVASNAA